MGKPARIDSIDLLRAVTLFGICIVHLYYGYGTGFANKAPIAGIHCYDWIQLFLVTKCKCIFSMLFGLSFYFMMRNPANSSRRFVWRCFLLAGFGMLDAVFYSDDVLMAYGICGMLLVPFRRLRWPWLLTAFVIVSAIPVLLADAGVHLADWVGPIYRRYPQHASLWYVFQLWPNAILLGIKRLLTGDIFRVLGYFLLGYTFGISGIIEKSEKTINWITVLVLTALYVASFYISFPHGMGFLHTLFGGLCYASVIIWLYNMVDRFRHQRADGAEVPVPVLNYYGKLGLSNYIILNWIGVWFINDFGLGMYHHLNLAEMMGVFVFIYVAQVWFSYVWLKHHKYGPFEGIWRTMTNWVK